MISNTGYVGVQLPNFNFNQCGTNRDNLTICHDTSFTNSSLAGDTSNIRWNYASNEKETSGSYQAGSQLEGFANCGIPTKIILTACRPSLPSPYQAFSNYSMLYHCRIDMISQPEEQHRARYQTEGSRGFVKDRTGSGYPRVQLIGWNGHAILHVFVASESGCIQPHASYQVCMVDRKRSTQCSQHNIDGVNVLQMPFTSANDWKLSVECIGILKLRRSDLEDKFQHSTTKRRLRSNSQRDNLKWRNRRQEKARLVFRAILLSDCETIVDTVQVASDPITCSQIIANPVINLVSIKEATTVGGHELIILGKNLGRGCQIWFRQTKTTKDLTEPIADSLVVGDQTVITSVGWAHESKFDGDEKYVWQAEAVIKSEFSHQNHLVCHIPAYDGPSSPITEPLLIELVVTYGEQCSKPHSFHYNAVPRGLDSNYSPNPLFTTGTNNKQDNSDRFETDSFSPSNACEINSDGTLTEHEWLFSDVVKEPNWNNCGFDNSMCIDNTDNHLITTRKHQVHRLVSQESSFRPSNTAQPSTLFGLSITNQRFHSLASSRTHLDERADETELDGIATPFFGLLSSPRSHRHSPNAFLPDFTPSSTPHITKSKIPKMAYDSPVDTTVPVPNILSTPPSSCY